MAKKAGYRQTLNRLRAVLGGGMILEGSVCRVSAGAGHWHLTRKENGRTSTLYVPDAEVEAVKEAAARRQPHRPTPVSPCQLAGEMGGLPQNACMDA